MAVRRKARKRRRATGSLFSLWLVVGLAVLGGGAVTAVACGGRSPDRDPDGGGGQESERHDARNTLFGIVSAVAPLVAQARGRGDHARRFSHDHDASGKSGKAL